MTHIKVATWALAAVLIACSSPAKVEVRPNPLVLEGKDAKGKLEAVIFDEDGKELTKGYDVTWLCVDPATAKVQQDGTVEAEKSGKTLVDVEIVGTEIHGSGAIEVRIPSWVEVSGEELGLVLGKPDATVWAEVRADTGFPIKDYLATWKVDNPAILAIEQSNDTNKGRAFLTVKPLAAGETYLTASYKDLAADIRVVVSPE
jgi:hypothetical protein